MNPCVYHVRLIVVGAYNIPNVSTIGKMDAFAKITYHGNEYCTSVLHNCGTNPLWNYIVNFNGTDPVIQIALYDKRILNDKYIGEVNLDCSRIPHGDHCFSISLTDHGIENSCLGKLRINVSLSKNVNDVSHHMPSISVPIPSPHNKFTVPVPSRAPIAQGVPLMQRPDMLPRMYRKVPVYDNSPRSKASSTRQLYPSPVELNNRRTVHTYYPIIPPQKN